MEGLTTEFYSCAAVWFTSCRSTVN